MAEEAGWVVNTRKEDFGDSATHMLGESPLETVADGQK